MNIYDARTRFLGTEVAVDRTVLNAPTTPRLALVEPYETTTARPVAKERA
jgi:hypothetical protein